MALFNALKIHPARNRRALVTAPSAGPVSRIFNALKIAAGGVPPTPRRGDPPPGRAQMTDTEGPALPALRFLRDRNQPEEVR